MFEVTPEEEDEFVVFANRQGVSNIIARSIAPSISCNEDIKKGIACLLFGGSLKETSDGRIHVLIIGDTATGKSQPVDHAFRLSFDKETRKSELLKSVEQAAPIAVYTSGKGSSSAILTAKETTDPTTCEFVRDNGVMSLADGGVVCIDDFHRMCHLDYAEIRQTMEQQTTPTPEVAISSMPKSKCSVLAVVDHAFRDSLDTLWLSESIDLVCEIMLRFDMVFVVDNFKKADEVQMCAMQVPVNADVRPAGLDANNGVMPLLKLKKYIDYCRNRCVPLLTDEVKNHIAYQLSPLHSDSLVPETFGQLQTVIRIAESLAKMRLSSSVDKEDADEAVRLFKARFGNLDGMNWHASLLEMVRNRLKEKIMPMISKEIFAQDIIESRDHVVGFFVDKGYERELIEGAIDIMVEKGKLMIYNFDGSQFLSK